MVFVSATFSKAMAAELSGKTMLSGIGSFKGAVWNVRLHTIMVLGISDFALQWCWDWGFHRRDISRDHYLQTLPHTFSLLQTNDKTLGKILVQLFTNRNDNQF